MCVWCRLLLATAVLAGLQESNAEGTDGSEHSDPLPSVSTAAPVDSRPLVKEVLQQISPNLAEPVVDEKKASSLFSPQVTPESNPPGSSASSVDNVVKNSHTITSKDFAERTASVTGKKLAEEKASETETAVSAVASKDTTIKDEVIEPGTKPDHEIPEQKIPEGSGQMQTEMPPAVGSVTLKIPDASAPDKMDTQYVNKRPETGITDQISQDVNAHTDDSHKQTVTFSVKPKPQQNDQSHSTNVGTALPAVPVEVGDKKMQVEGTEDKHNEESAVQDHREENTAPAKSLTQETPDISIVNTKQKENQQQNDNKFVQENIASEAEEKSAKNGDFSANAEKTPEKSVSSSVNHPEELQPSGITNVKDTINAENKQSIVSDDKDKKTETKVKLMDVLKTTPPTFAEPEKSVPVMHNTNVQSIPVTPDEHVNPISVIPDEQTKHKPLSSDEIILSNPVIPNENFKPLPAETVNHPADETHETVSHPYAKVVKTAQPLVEVPNGTPKQISAIGTETVAAVPDITDKTVKSEVNTPVESVHLESTDTPEATSKPIVPPVMQFTIEEVTPAEKEEYSSAVKDKPDIAMGDGEKDKGMKVEDLQGIGLDEASKIISDELKAYSNNLVLAWEQKKTSVGWTGEAANVLRDYMEKISISQQAHNTDCVKSDLEKHAERLKSLEEVIRTCESGLKREDWKELQAKTKEVFTIINEIVEEANNAISHLQRDDPRYIHEKGVIEDDAKRKLVELDTESIKETFSKLEKKSLKKDEQDLKECLNNRNEKSMVADTLSDMMRIKNNCVG